MTLPLLGRVAKPCGNVVGWVVGLAAVIVVVQWS